MINLYTNNPTIGKSDGTLVSQDHTQTSPLSVTLKTGQQKAVKIAVRCDQGFTAVEGAEISLAYWDGQEYQATGGNIAKWYLALDDNYTDSDDALNKGTWEHTANITNAITDKNTILWAKYDGQDDTTPMNDDKTAICIKATVEAV
ncbi:hypothetical protein [Anaerovibrio sp. JC8]|uniref:hypothetical protein n=1 Tax=Anaerovibrio sp. JC8 TaxID=1240085 RepID=UPI000A1062AD|nr:hypothetical protein [Anaerovibrio sp. JC8]